MFMRIVVYAPIIGVGAIIKVLNTNASMTWINRVSRRGHHGDHGRGVRGCNAEVLDHQKLLDKMNSVLREFLDGLPVIGRSIPGNMKKRNLIRSIPTDENEPVCQPHAGVLMPMMMLVMNRVGIRTPDRRSSDRHGDAAGRQYDGVYPVQHASSAAFLLIAMVDHSRGRMFDQGRHGSANFELDYGSEAAEGVRSQQQGC